MSIQRLIGIYQADGGLVGELRYVVGKLRGTSGCALCDITHGMTSKKPDFRACEARLPLPIELVHLNERTPALRAFTEGHTPCVVGQTDTGFVMLLDAPMLEQMGGSVGAFEASLQKALSRHNSIPG